MVRIARPTTGRRSVIASALLIAVGALLAAGVLGSSASGQSGPTGTLVLRELNKGSTFTQVKNKGKRLKDANLQGDLIVSVSRVTDVAGNRVGRVHFACITTLGARDFTKSKFACTAIAELRDGTLIFQFVDAIQPTTTGAITGGTGAYANARGTFLKKETDYGTENTITFAP